MGQESPSQEWWWARMNEEIEDVAQTLLFLLPCNVEESCGGVAPHFPIYTLTQKAWGSFARKTPNSIQNAIHIEKK